MALHVTGEVPGLYLDGLHFLDNDLVALARPVLLRDRCFAITSEHLGNLPLQIEHPEKFKAYDGFTLRKPNWWLF